MKVVGLVSGGKDSCFAMMKCLEYGHEVVALANLLPANDSVDELDSYMYQTVGHQIIVSYANCMGVPLFRRRIQGSTRNHIPEHLKVKVVAIKLRKYASLWWDHIKKKRRQQGKSRVKTWTKKKKILTAKFLPLHYRQEAFLEYHSLAQHNVSVEQFISDFDRLRMRCGADEEEEQVVARFLGALKPEIADIVQLQQFWTLDDVTRLALKVEKQLQLKPRSTPTL